MLQDKNEVTYKFAHFNARATPVFPQAVEAQHFTIILQELLEWVLGSFTRANRSHISKHLGTGLYVRVLGALLTFFQLSTRLHIKILHVVLRYMGGWWLNLPLCMDRSQ